MVKEKKEDLYGSEEGKYIEKVEGIKDENRVIKDGIDETTIEEEAERTAKRLLILRNMREQDYEMLKICEERGVNPLDTFRGYVDKEGNEVRMRIIASGEEGSKKGKEMLEEFYHCDNPKVKNETSRRIDWEDLPEEHKKGLISGIVEKAKSYMLKGGD